jgi:hypothetical protein
LLVISENDEEIDTYEAVASLLESGIRTHFYLKSGRKVYFIFVPHKFDDNYVPILLREDLDFRTRLSWLREHAKWMKKFTIPELRPLFDELKYQATEIEDICPYGSCTYPVSKEYLDTTERRCRENL